ncbi:unnamed protein product, partial [Lymnaea stagnalis]
QKLLHSTLDSSVLASAEEKILELCGQEEVITFSECLPQRMLSKCVKIGEGVYGEVFRTYSGNQSLALKIIPIEGDFLVNECPQKKYEEILPEMVIAQELSSLADSEINTSANFCQVKRMLYVKGQYPDVLLEQWDLYSKNKHSENDRPDIFPESQLFIVFEFHDGGCALEKFKFNNHLEAFSVLRQVVFALAVAEEALCFEHRDLHIGNILVKPCKEKNVTFQLKGELHTFPSCGVFATIIDFTISRLEKDGCAVFCDVATDDGLFEGTGDFQFDVYRDMKTENGNNWEPFQPHSNILWVNYLCKKMVTFIK